MKITKIEFERKVTIETIVSRKTTFERGAVDCRVDSWELIHGYTVSRKAYKNGAISYFQVSQAVA